MKSVKLFGVMVPVWLLIGCVAIVSAISIVGTVYALVTVLNQYNVGYIQLGESKTFTILVTNNTVSPSNLNLSTVTINPSLVTASLSWKDDSGIQRTSPLIMDGITSFNYPILGPLNCTIVGTSQGDFNITINIVPSNSTFLNYTDIIPM